MYLADELAAARGSPGDRILYGAISELSRRIAGSESFLLKTSVVGACEHVAATRPSTLLGSLGYARLPHPNVWLEWDPADNERLGTATEQRPAPQRIGCQLAAGDDSGLWGVATWAWRHRPGLNMPTPDSRLHVAPIGALFDWRPQTDPDRQWRDYAQLLDDRELAELTRGWFKTGDVTELVRDEIQAVRRWRGFTVADSEVAAVVEIARRLPAVITPACRRFVRFFRDAPFPYDEKRRLMRGWRDDLEGEWPFVLAFVLMLNSKNGLELKRQDLARINKARERAGKRPLQQFIETDLRLAERWGEHRAGVTAADRLAARRHKVRGHFKVRKTGVFWWPVHWRGQGDELQRLRYVAR
jgi:hypothetical protein